MTISKKGSRKIIVDNIEYRWTIRNKNHSTNTFASVELYEDSRSVLSIWFPWVKYDWHFGIAEQPITPKHIEQCIRQALKEGWRPDKKNNLRINHKIEEIL